MDNVTVCVDVNNEWQNTNSISSARRLDRVIILYCYNRRVIDIIIYYYIDIKSDDRSGAVTQDCGPVRTLKRLHSFLTKTYYILTYCMTIVMY